MTPSIAYGLTYVPGVHEHRDRIARHVRRRFRAEVIRDEERKGVWGATRDAYARLARLRPEATHAFVLQDDFLPAPHFEDLIAAAVAARPEHAIQVFTHARFVRDAYERGDAWATSYDLVWGGTTVLPMSWVPSLLDLTTRVPDDASADVTLASWLVGVWDQTIWHTAPSLMQHAEPQTSLLGHGNSRRVASALVKADEHPDFSVIPQRPIHYSARSRTKGAPPL